MASIWGGDSPSVAWGQNTWQSNTVTQSLTAPTAITASLGDLDYAGSIEGWGRDTWGVGAWGEQSTVNIEIGEPLTGLEITGSLGTPTPNYDFIFTLSDSLLLTASRGSLSINNGADHTQGLGGLAATMSVGTTEVADVVFGPSSFLVTATLGAAAAYKCNQLECYLNHM